MCNSKTLNGQSEGVSKKAQRFRYVGLDLYDKERSERPYYCNFQVWLGEELILDFYTNKEFDGYFLYDERTCNYKQFSGTWQFRMPSSKNAARNFLRKEAIEAKEELDRDREMKEYWNSPEGIKAQQEIDAEIQRAWDEAIISMDGE